MEKTAAKRRVENRCQKGKTDYISTSEKQPIPGNACLRNDSSEQNVAKVYKLYITTARTTDELNPEIKAKPHKQADNQQRQNLTPVLQIGQRIKQPQKNTRKKFLHATPTMPVRG